MFAGFLTTPSMKKECDNGESPMIITTENYRTIDLGTKAKNLFLLAEAGFSVPPFFCVDETFSEEEVLAYLTRHFPDTALFSVRSCASLEDSADFSFAGQFKTFLRVPKDDICARIREVLSDAAHPETISYCRIHDLDPAALRMHVIVQEMVVSDLSGILFTANPQGLLNESVIVCGVGTGDLVVEDKTDTTTYYYNLTDRIFYYEQAGSSPLLSNAQVGELIRLSRKIRELMNITPKAALQHPAPGFLSRRIKKSTPSRHGAGQDAGYSTGYDTEYSTRYDIGYGTGYSTENSAGYCTEYDIEFAIKNDTLYVLQARPITSLKYDAPVIILDNSNIVESYPGITLPLTQSFIREAYYQVFKNLLLHLTKESDSVQRIDGTLRHMVDMANGRIYYRISNWYDVLLFLPFYSRLIPIWQEMMGVKGKAVSSGMQGNIRRGTRFKVALSFFRLLRTCPKEMDKLDLYFQEIIKRFDALDLDTDDNRILLRHYRSLQDMTVKRWDMTLVNDMYGFLFTGLLKARLKAKHIPDPEFMANRAISGIRKLESMRPIEALRKMAAQAKEENLLAELQAIDSNEAYFQYIRNDSPFSRSMQEYIQNFGDRNVEELKLESKTFRTDPVLLVRCILQYAETSPDPSWNVSDDAFGNISKNASDDTSENISPNAFDGTPENFSESTKPPQNGTSAPPRLAGLSAFFAGRAAVGIRNRERSRLHRGRLYGMMRSLALRMGENLSRQGRITQTEDIFWLYLEEIETASSDPALDLKGIIAGRKDEYAGFSALPAYSRLVFSGKITHKHPKPGTGTACSSGMFSSGSTCAGTACSSGIAEGEVLLVKEPSPLLDTKGKILVTKMTDPGWVFLIAPAKAVVSEKGSLLSHTAIISRELGKPAVVGIEHITEYLKTGDRIRVDGDTGTVTVLSIS